jgi:hypothetical protein
VFSKFKGALNRFIFFVGWLLSPLTFWNDAFVNIPIAYICASLAYRMARLDFVKSMLVFYWLSNLLGILIIYFAGRRILADKKTRAHEITITILTILIYSAILILISNAGFLKPL